MLNKTVVIDVVGLSSRLIGKYTPFIRNWGNQKTIQPIHPVLPAVTTSAQYTYLTGTYPGTHGIVGNGWYFKDECEIKFWRQSNHLVQAPKIWEILKAEDPEFTCANMFWWYNMYSSVDYSVTPRPQYPANGLKIPDVYTQPAGLRDELQKELGTFPLFKFWGPKTSIQSSQWIAAASRQVTEKYDPTLTLIYLPHLDYNLQKYGYGHESVNNDLEEIDTVVKDLVEFYESRDTQVIILSEYGITHADHPVHINRLLRREGLVAVRKERGTELLDPGASKAFAVADHQICHVYINDPSINNKVKELVENEPGVGEVLDQEGKKAYRIDHERAGDLVLIADDRSWFSYYYWLDDTMAPDYARTVDIHRKPGYDPVEMFVDPRITLPMLKVGTILLKKKLGFRYLMNVIPLDATLIRGSHGRIPEDKADWPVLISSVENEAVSQSPVNVFGIIKDTVLGKVTTTNR